MWHRRQCRFVKTIPTADSGTAPLSTCTQCYSRTVRQRGPRSTARACVCCAVPCAMPPAWLPPEDAVSPKSSAQLRYSGDKATSDLGLARVVGLFAWPRHTNGMVATAPLDPCAFEMSAKRGNKRRTCRAEPKAETSGSASVAPPAREESVWEYLSRKAKAAEYDQTPVICLPRLCAFAYPAPYPEGTCTHTTPIRL